MEQQKKSNAQTEKAAATPPQESLPTMYADCKKDIILSVRQIINKYQMPPFLSEGILESLLSDFRHEAYLELSSEVARLKQENAEYTEGKIKEVQEQHDKEMQSLVSQFEAGPAKTK